MGGDGETGRCLGNTQECTGGASNLGVVGRSGRADVTQMTWVQIPAPPLPSLVTLARSFMSVNLHFLFCKMGIIISPRVVGVLNETVIRGP